MIHLIAGARPNFMKIAPIIHTGQHYDYKMSESFLGYVCQNSGRNNSIRCFSCLTLGDNKL